MMKLYLSGKYRLLYNETPITGFRSDKVRALLAYLVLAKGRPFTRTHLSNLLWADYLSSSARASLRVALSNLRQVLAPMDDLLELDDQIVCFNHQSPQFWCDVLADETLINSPLFLLDLQHISAMPFQIWRRQQTGESS
ncbi:MAG: winged helix-turn-helix domain-containing protein [Ardenticatenaceae bacterium]|nr:winged helix-turn-helix domain-containing protein [Ardenticatenaceae bacterium]